MSDDNDNVTKLVILTLGIVAIGFFAYLIFKESMKYQVGGHSQQMSLTDDNYFQMDRRLHQLEMSRGNVRTLQPVQKVEQSVPTSTEYLQTPDAPPIPRKVVSMNKVQTPNVQNLSKADQEKVRRLFFNML